MASLTKKNKILRVY